MKNTIDSLKNFHGPTELLQELESHFVPGMGMDDFFELIRRWVSMPGENWRLVHGDDVDEYTLEFTPDFAILSYIPCHGWDRCIGSTCRAFGRCRLLNRQKK